MNTYHVYEEGGCNTRHSGRFTRHEAFKAASAAEALAAFDPPAEIQTNDEDDTTAWSAFDDNIEEEGLEHLLCADLNPQTSSTSHFQ